MSTDVFGARLDDEIGAVIERAEIEWRRPGIIHQNEGAFVVRDLRDDPDVLDLETKRAGRLQIDGACVRAKLRGNFGSDCRIVKGRCDAEAGKNLLAEGPCRSVGIVGY